MLRALKIILGFEIVLGLLWTLVAAMAHGAGGLGAVYLFFYIYAVFGLMFLVAAWACWKYPNQRWITLWIMMLPIVFWFAPQLVRSLAGDHLSYPQLVVVSVVATILLLAVCWVVPRRITGFIPDGLLRSRILNWLVLLSVLGAWLFFILAIMYVANDKTTRASGGEALGLAIVIASMYLIWLGIGSFITATWAWLCLRSDITDQPRKLNIAQLVFATPGVLLGAAVAFWLAGQGHL